MSSQHWSVLRTASIAIVAAFLAGAAFALGKAAMRLPPEFSAAADRLPARGYGGANRGEFTLGDYSGHFTRIESRLGILDPLYASNRGKSSFTLSGPDIDGEIAAECSFRQNVVTVGIVNFDAKKLVYVCDIVDAGRRAVGSLTLGEPKPANLKARVLAHELRHGEAEFDGVPIEIDSVHDYERARFKSPTPVGYVLRHEALVVGAIELTDTNPTIFLLAHSAPEIRRAALVAALGLSVLRDPAESMLGE